GRYAYTVHENVALAGSEGAERSRVEGALAAAGLEATLARLEGGVEQALGKEFGGTELSGGQWQKLAIARALHRDADLLVLDEPTAALDPRSGHELFERFAGLADGRSVVLIAHRLASVRMADRVLVLAHGRLVEAGAHPEL